jgi:hypothetical protein
MKGNLDTNKKDKILNINILMRCSILFFLSSHLPFMMRFALTGAPTVLPDGAGGGWCVDGGLRRLRPPLPMLRPDGADCSNLVYGVLSSEYSDQCELMINDL